jgi:bla regulator protein BlaR1
MLQWLLRKHKTACLSVCLAVLPLALAVSALTAQTVASQGVPEKAGLPVFDVSTIRPNKSGSGRWSSLTTDHGTYTGENITLKSLLTLAFGVRPDLIFGLPGWTENARFDVSAKVVDSNVKDLAALTREQRQAMMQGLLADRFQLKSHMETRTLPVYELVIAKGGVKFKESTPAAPGGRSGISTHNTELTANDSPIALFTNTLSDYLHRAVIDKTGLTAKYDFTLKWTRD